MPLLSVSSPHSLNPLLTHQPVETRHWKCHEYAVQNSDEKISALKYRAMAVTGGKKNPKNQKHL